MRDFVLTSESVTVGHPDKLCDQISDAVIDAFLAAGLRREVSAECATATGIVFLSVRAAEEPPCDLGALARRVVEEAGYGAAPTVMLDLAPGGRAGGLADHAADHMTTAFGHACTQTPARMAFPIVAAHALTRALDAARVEGRVPWLGPDAQAQVAVAFANRRPTRLAALAITAATAAAPSAEKVRETLLREVVAPAFATAGLRPDEGTRQVTVVIPAPGGPAAHSGLTGRKLADDGYGGFVRQSTSALSGKSPGRIDRTAAYAARHAARCVVAAGLAEECEVQLSYMIGDSRPVTVEVETFDTGRIPDAEISLRLAQRFDFRAGAIAERFGLWDLPARRGGRFFRDLATYGQIGRDDLAPPWEDEGMAALLA